MNIVARALAAARRRLRGPQRERAALAPRAFLFDILPQSGVCAEIGVWKGAFSRAILDQSTPTKLHLIDPWSFQPSFPGRRYGGSDAADQADMDAIHAAVIRGVGSDPGVEIHRKPSSEAVADFEDGYFDWIYIDGDHSYKSVLQDLELYWPKVKNDGFLAGDDYDWSESEDFPVRRAVDEFVASGRASVDVVKNGQFVLRRQAGPQ